MFTVIGYYRDSDEVVVVKVKAKTPKGAARAFFAGSVTRKDSCGIAAVLAGGLEDLTEEVIPNRHGLVSYDHLRRVRR
jgi:hypothetical protein